jgi:hypothetical protein
MADELEFVFDGKRVVLNADIPAPLGWAQLQRANDRGGKSPSFDDVVEELMAFIREWELEGDPKDPKTYKTMGFFTLMALRGQVQERINDQMETIKNLISPST